MKKIVLLGCFLSVLCICQTSFAQIYPIPLHKIPTPNPMLQNFYRSQVGKIEIGVNKFFIHDQFESKVQGHKVVAILPLEVVIKKDPKRKSKVQQLERRAFIEAKNGYPVLHASLQRAKASSRVALQLQDITITQNLLAENNISAAAIKDLPPAELANLLGVDAVITCKIEREERLVAESNWWQNLKRCKGFTSASAGTATISIYDATNELLWQYEGLLTYGLGNNFDQTIINLGKKTASRFPYFQASN